MRYDCWKYQAPLWSRVSAWVALHACLLSRCRPTRTAALSPWSYRTTQLPNMPPSLDLPPFRPSPPPDHEFDTLLEHYPMLYKVEVRQGWSG